MTPPIAAEKILSDTAQVDSASVAPLSGSRKIYIEGSRPDIRVPMREISLTASARMPRLRYTCLKSYR